MSFIDDLANAPPTGLKGTDKTFIDADTLVGTDGNKYRIQGIDAPEVEKWVNGQYKLGTAGGQAATETLSALANEHGFTNIVPVMRDDGTPDVDQFGRAVVDLKDSTGRSFKSAILEAGILDPTKYTTNTDRITSELGQLRREQASLAGVPQDTDWDKARDTVQQAMWDEGQRNNRLRIQALDEAQLAAYNQAGLGRMVQQDTVQVRDYGRDLNNQSLSPFTDSWEQGWLGVAEGAYGMANMIGESWDIDPLSTFGEAGVARIQNRLEDEYGQKVLDWKDVDGIGAGWEYVTNNMAMSLPYMIGTVAAAGVGTIVGGPAGTAVALSPGLIYAGQVWNEMEDHGDKGKSASVALT